MCGCFFTFQKTCRTQEQAAGANRDFPGNIFCAAYPIYERHIFYELPSSSASRNDNGVVRTQIIFYFVRKNGEPQIICAGICDGAKIPCQVRNIVHQLEAADGIVDTDKVQPGGAVEENVSEFHIVKIHWFPINPTLLQIYLFYFTQRRKDLFPRFTMLYVQCISFAHFAHFAPLRETFLRKSTSNNVHLCPNFEKRNE